MWLSVFSEIALFLFSFIFWKKQQESWKVVSLCSNVSVSVKKHMYRPIHLTNKKGTLEAPGSFFYGEEAGTKLS